MLGRRRWVHRGEPISTMTSLRKEESVTNLLQSPDLSILAAPGGGGSVRLDGECLVSDDCRRYPIERGIVRMLEDVDAGLAAELEAQEAAIDIYTNEGFLLTRYERTLARVAVEDLLIRSDGPILDAGCGVGMIGRYYPHLDLYGVDASFPLLEEATTGYRMRIECSVERLPFRDEAFGAVLALNVLHHVMDPERSLAELARVLRPGGLLVALDPRKVGLVELAKRLLRKGDPAYASTHKAFGVDEYMILVRAGGAFDLEETRRFGLLALLYAGGLDQLGISTRLPRAGDLLRSLTLVDGVIGRMPGIRTAGLYLGARAQRRASTSAGV